MRTHLLAMSFDAGASPQVYFSGLPQVVDPGKVPCGWGFGWYPEGERAASVIKDPNCRGDDPMVRMLQDWSHFRSTVFVSFVLGAADRRTHQDTHPFQLRHAGRDFLLSHNGELEDYVQGLPLGDYHPAGRTDSEHILCWLGSQFVDHGADRLADLEWPLLHQLFQRINQLGTANLVLSDGLDLVFYRDQRAHNQAYWVRRLPQSGATRLRAGLVELDLSDAAQHNRTAVLFSTLPPEEEDWTPMQPGQMLVARRGKLLWNSLEATPDSPPASAGPPHPSGSRSGPDRRRYRVVHETTYTYEQAVERSSHIFRLAPLSDRAQQLLEYDLHISVPGTRREYEDVFGNHTTLLEVETPFQQLRVVSRSLVEIHPPALDPNGIALRRLSIPLAWMPWQRQMMSPYLLPPELPENQLLELSDFARAAVERSDYHLLDTLIDLNRTIHRDFKYAPLSTTLATTPYDVLWSRRGVCQDFANLLICLARLLEVPARYRMGYIRTGSDYANQLQSEASHAWVECYLPWIGWVGFDPTNGSLAGPDHIRVACGRTFIDATPTAGTLFRGGGGEQLEVKVRTEMIPD